jgi:exopolyphosphatase/guanosine-5'-triphosphate,3'-diphosphate pyrophosphatase
MPIIHKVAECNSLIAAIDIGTNSIRLLIGCVDNGKIIRIATDRYITRLGEGLSRTGELNANNIEKSISCLQKIKAICDSY